MARYNTFVVLSTKGGGPLLVTSSARKAKRLLGPGRRIEVWTENRKSETVYTRTASTLDAYTAAEKDYIRQRQTAAEHRNRLRRAYREANT